MNWFTKFELIALELLAAPMVGSQIFEEVFRTPVKLKIQEFDDGYDLVIEHPKLPVEVVAAGSPKVSGNLGSVRVRYVIRIESHALSLHCRTPSNQTIPPSFRQSPVLISVG